MISAELARPLGAPPSAHPGSPDRGEHSEKKFRADIEGLRGVAVLLVVWYHVHVAGFSGGFIGVDVFFVISGYLITGLLVAETRSSGRIDVPAFYARRIRRLLPAAMLVVTTTLVVGAFIFSPDEQSHFAASAMAASMYLSNFRYVLSGQGYFGPGLDTDPLLHTWSLAVEEQFYLLWPLLIWLGFKGRHPLRRLAALVGIIGLASFVASLFLTEHRPEWAFFTSPSRAWEFGVGAAASLIPVAMLRGRRTPWLLVGWIGLAAVLVTAATITSVTPFPGAVALLPVVGTALILAAGVAAPGSGVGRLLATSPLQHLGRLSYSWYLWHWPILILTEAFFLRLTLAGRLACAAGSLAIAAITHVAVENPIRFNRRLSAAPFAGLALGIVLTTFGASVAYSGRKIAEREALSPAQQRLKPRFGQVRECSVWTPGSDDVTCGATIPEGKPAVVLFGDSHAAAWRPALEPLIREHGWRLIQMTKGACPSAFGTTKARYDWDPDFAQHCAAWRERSLRQIGELHPILVVVANSREHVQGTRRKDDRRRSTPAEWEIAVRRLLRDLDADGTHVLLIRDTPRLGVDVPVCLGRALAQRLWRDLQCASDRASALDGPVFHAERAAASGFASVTVADPTDRFCDETTCYGEKDGIMRYNDTDHMSPQFSAELASQMAWWVTASLDVAVAQPR